MYVNIYNSHIKYAINNLQTHIECKTPGIVASKLGNKNWALSRHKSQ